MANHPVSPEAEKDSTPYQVADKPERFAWYRFENSFDFFSSCIAASYDRYICDVATTLQTRYTPAS